MNNEQNIYDILKLLKESVHKEAAEEENEEKRQRDGSGEGLSNEALQARLKQQYETEHASTEQEERQESNAYSLDHDLLREMEQTEQEKDPDSESYSEEDVSLRFDESSEEENGEEDLAPWEESASHSTAPLITASHEEALAEELNEEADLAAKELTELFDSHRSVEEDDTEAELSEVEEIEDEAEESIPLTDEKADEAFRKLLDEDGELSGVSVQEVEVESKDVEADTYEYQQFPDIEQFSRNDLVRDYETSEESSQAENLTASEGEQFLSILAEEIKEDPQIIETAEELVNDSVFELMRQLGCEEELERVSEDAVSEEFVEEPTEEEQDEGEYRSAEQTAEIADQYRRRSIYSLVRVIGIGVLTFVLFLYDTMPLWGADFPGLTDYFSYPGAYLLIGLQFTLFSALCLWKPLWLGVKKLCTLQPDLYSVVALAVLFTAAYDVAMVFALSDAPTHTFHFLTSVMIFGVGLAEYLFLRREKRIFSIYSDEKGTKYTLTVNGGKHSAAEKMYSGGLSSEKTVYEPTLVDFPKGFFRVMEEENHLSSRLIAVMLIPTILLAIAAAVFGMLLNETSELAFSAAMAMIYAVFPLSMVASITLPAIMSTRRLQKRGIALTSKRMVDQYVGADVLVFSDRHLFRTCDTKETGIMFYEQDQANTVLGCLQLLFSRIKGPMSDLFESLPQECRLDFIRIRRITRTGIEAFVDHKHILLVGDALFMQRYGLNFPSEKERPGRVTLYVSLDGKKSAKINAKYTIEPVFEMLVERLAECGVSCVVETYDPLIGSSYVATARSVGNSPISIVHKNAADMNYSQKTVRSRQEDTGLLVENSRLKLAEAIVWCHRLWKIRRTAQTVTCIISILGAILVGGALGCGWISVINQYWLLLFSALSVVLIFAVTASSFPKKDYFTVEAVKNKLATEQQKRASHDKKKESKKERKKKHE